MLLKKGIVPIAVVLLDQVSKGVCGKILSPGQEWAVVPFFSLVNVKNSGSVWGFFQGKGGILALLGILALILLFRFRSTFGLISRADRAMFGLLCGGIMGNTIDRLQLGYVVDFLSFHVKTFEWPAFNLADSALSVATFYFFTRAFFPQKK
ncbi:MAG: signal peptidase II [Puniceicoccales bacterium]|nr:signal peptidase II [Puniceicoccales bacterium]